MLRRSPLKRRGPLRRGGRLTRRTPLRIVNRERRLERYVEAFGDRGALIRAMPCLCLGNEGAG